MPLLLVLAVVVSPRGPRGLLLASRQLVQLARRRTEFTVEFFVQRQFEQTAYDLRLGNVVRFPRRFLRLWVRADLRRGVDGQRDADKDGQHGARARFTPC